jgi:hypothetical protein
MKTNLCSDGVHPHNRLRILAGAFIALAWLVFGAAPSYAVTLTVTNIADNGAAGTLRALLSQAVSGDTINFTAGLSGQTITLTNGQLTVTKNLTIDASALAAGIKVSGNNFSRVFLITNVTVTLNSLAILNGKVSADSGGGIRNEGNLTALNCVFGTNVAQGGNGVTPGAGGNGGPGGGGAGLGGAIYSEGAVLTLGGCSFNGNLAQGGNGGAGNNNGFLPNAGGNGGGPNGGLNGGIIQSGNPGGFGGGGAGGGGSSGGGYSGGLGGFGGGGGGGGADGNGGNGGNGGGGGAYGGSGGAAMSSVSGGGGGGAGLGGAVFTLTGLVTITNCTFTSNEATNGLGGAGSFQNPDGTNGQGVGGALFNYGTNLTDIYNNVFNGNTASTGSPNVVSYTLTILTLADNGTGSLRTAITNAAESFTTNLNFAPALAGQTITLTNGQIAITNNLTIDASALADGIAVSGNNTSRVFLITNATVTLNSLAIINGYVSGDSGGGIRNEGSLTALNCVFGTNVAQGGNGVTPGSGMFGFAFDGGGSGGGGAGLGGAIYSEGAVLTLGGCSFNGNLAQGGNGGTGNGIGENSLNSGGNGGGPSAGLGGAAGNGGILGFGGTFGQPGTAGGFGGGGGGGASSYDDIGSEYEQIGYNGGSGGFGGGGGGGGGGQNNGGGAGGSGGLYGGSGAGAMTVSGYGGGGAGLGGAVFTLEGTVTITNCIFNSNEATNGLGGETVLVNGADGQGLGGGLFNLANNFSLADTSFSGNTASTGSPDEQTLPVLTVTLNAGNLNFSWSATEAGFRVQYITNLTQPFVWQTLAGAVTNSSGFFQQTSSGTPGNSAFFRLFSTFIEP